METTGSLPKYLLIFLGFVLLVFTLYAVLKLPETSTDEPGHPKLSAINRFIRNRRAAENECLWVLIAKEGVGTLSSPNYPDKYPSNADCQWLITTLEENATISIFIDTLRIEPEKHCSLDSLQVYLGSSPLSPSLGPFCGHVSDRLLETNASTLLLVFHSDMAYEDAGFRIDYFTKSHDAECRELLTRGSDSFTSPGFPKNYPDASDCSTLIAVRENERIVLDFDSVDLEPGDGCTYDYVRVFDGNSTNATLLGQICQQTDDRSFESSSNALLVQFHSDDSVNRKGYRARYTSVDDRSAPIGNCVWDRNNGSVSSPNFPENYPSFANCSLWLLAPTPHHRVRVHLDVLLLEVDSNCSYDFLQISEGRPPSAASKILGKFCGRISEPKQVVSESHEVQIQFQSDDFVEFLGFKLRYEFLESRTENGDANDPDEATLRFSAVPQNATLSAGSSHMLHCDTEHPNAKIRWLKGDLFLGGENPLPGLQLLANHTLWIRNMGPHLAGPYSCVVVSEDDVIEATATLLLDGQRGNPPCKLEFRKTPVDSEFYEGEFAHLECLSASPDAQMSWEKDGRPLHKDGHVTVLKNGYIFVDRVELGDAGVYTCVARHLATGCSERVSAELKVSAKTSIDEICGVPRIGEEPGSHLKMKHGKIVGGLDARKGAYPWQVMLWDPSLRSFCGATLLNDRWIATAAHCLRSDQHDILWHAVKIKLGKHDTQNDEEEEMVTSIADSSAIVVHPGFDPFTYDNDLALIRTRDRVRFTDHILPVCLGDRNLTEFLVREEDPGTPRMGTVVGWGRLKEDGPAPRFLQEIKLPLRDQEVCKASTNGIVTRNMFCAGYSQEVIGDSCKGDSGGPFLMKDKDRWYLVGIVSWGEGCGRKNKYGFYTRIANHISWIRGIIKS